MQMHSDDDEYENDKKGQEFIVNHLLPGIRLQSALPRWWSAARESRKKRPGGIVIKKIIIYEWRDIGGENKHWFF